MSVGVAVPAIIAGALGALAPLLSFLSFDGIAVSGWDSRAFTEYYGLYSSGPLWITVMSIGVVFGGVSGLVRHLVSSRPVRNSDRIAAGTGMLALGIMLVINGLWAYDAIDEAAVLDSVFVEVGFGLYLTFLVGAATGIIGIVILAVKSTMPEQATLA